MPVELRARRARPSYRAMLELPDDEEGPPLSEDDASSGSAFEPTQLDDGESRTVENEPAQDSEEAEESVQEDESDAGPGPSKSSGKRKVAVTPRPKPPPQPRPAGSAPAPGLARPTTRQGHAPPLPSFNHRHRGIPLHFPPPQTFRLANKPSMFAPTDLIWTKSVADRSVRDRVARATSHNVGRGPVWELMEDRSWYKEYGPENQTRPIVYDALTVDERWQFLFPDQAMPYLPQTFGELSQPMGCFFGPYENQTKVQLNVLQTVQMAHFFPGSNSHVFYTGAPVWALDWCPAFVDELPVRNYEQHIAVAPFPSYSHSPEIGKRVTRPSFASIQIWNLSPTYMLNDGLLTNPEAHDDPGVLKCDLILCMESGAAHDLKWCPLPTHDRCEDIFTPERPRKLGVLAGTFEDGSLSFYVVPDPKTLSSYYGIYSPLIVKISPRLRVELEDTMCWCLDWANSDLIAVGCTNGSIAVFRVREALEHPPDEPLRPTHYFSLHQSAIRSLSWVRAPPTSASGVVRLDRDPTVIVSGGYDGAQIVTDIRDLRGNLMNRTRDVINTVGFSYHVGGPLASDHENTIKNFGLTPTTLGRGHALLEPSGPVWSIATSDFHPQVVVGSADGTCQATNIMKSTRKGGAVPFLIHKIFQLDYNRNSREFRMLENFLPYEHQDRQSASRATTKKKTTVDASMSTGAWSPEIGVTRVTWQSGSGLARAPLLASATASGLCRIDWLLGRFPNDRTPYRSIEVLRGEVYEADDDDEDDDDDGEPLPAD